ncbi:MAG: radical SAM protein [Euryarchaeota archaeon]|nr:radical SAM protein [Euryarchaeota archaeon]
MLFLCFQPTILLYIPVVKGPWICDNLVTIYNPSQNFITVSLTGDACSLQCPHCQGRFLKHMAPVVTPEELYALAKESSQKGVKGMLISGGCEADGQVPIFDYLDIIKNIKSNIDISINIHAGFVRLDNIPKLAGKGIDIVSFDVIGSPDVVKKIYGLDLEPDYFEKALAAFRDNGLKVVPHVTAGLGMGNDSGEENALETIARHGPDFVVINALMASDADELSGERLLEVLYMAREILPDDTAFGIGCMRPRGDIISAELVAELDIASVAMPSKGLVKELKALEMDIIEKDGCCAFWTIP